ncbi:MAG: hypothetical protein JXA67_07235, partial [Micromonosporaceae bacterium]|nr:hypothetical protein [Micromonosporaceae bacterium]
MAYDRRRAIHIGGWCAFGLAQTSLHVFSGSMVVLYNVFMMAATCSGAVIHGLAAARSTGRARRIWSVTAVGLACWAFAEVSVGIPALIAGVAHARGAVANLLNLGALVLAIVAMLMIPTAPPNISGKLRMRPQENPWSQGYLFARPQAPEITTAAPRRDARNHYRSPRTSMIRNAAF